MIFVQDNSVQSINAALNVIQKNQTPAQTSRGRRFSSSASNKFSISVSGNAISCYIPDFPELVANVTNVKLILPQLDTGSPTLNINGLGAKPIKAVRAGELVDIVAHTGYWAGASSTSSRVWDNNTTLELIYDGTNWVVVGNPVLCSYFATDKSYSVYANGYIHQWGIQSGVVESSQTRTPLLVPYTQDFTIVDACTARTPYYSSYTADFTTLIFRIGSTSGSETIRWATFGY